MILPLSRFVRYLLICVVLCAVCVGMTWSAIERHDAALQRHHAALQACLARTGEAEVTQDSPCSDDPELLDLAQQRNEADEQASQWLGISSVVFVILLALLTARLGVFLATSLLRRG